MDALQLTEAYEVGAHQDPQLASLLLASLAIPGVSLVLHSHPQLVHLREVQQDEVDGVVNSSCLTLRRAVMTTMAESHKMAAIENMRGC